MFPVSLKLFGFEVETTLSQSVIEASEAWRAAQTFSADCFYQ